MSRFDATGGPWGFILRASLTEVGLDVTIPAGTFTVPAGPEDIGIIPDQSLYVGTMADGEVYLDRHNWFNQGAQYRAVTANYPAYPRVALVDYYQLSILGMPMTVLSSGVLDTAPFYALLSDPSITSDESKLRQLWALLSAAAVSDAQRATLATTLGLRTPLADLLHDFGVLVREASGAFTDQDLLVVRNTLSLFPDPVIDQLHLLVFDDTLPATGGQGSGGLIVINDHSTAGGFVAYPSGRQQPNRNGLANILTHEIGHLCDTTSMAVESNEYDALYAAGVGIADANLYGLMFSQPRTEDIIFYWVGWCNDSRTILDEVATRGNAILAGKLAHVIDLLPSLTPDTAPFFTNDGSGNVSVRLATVTRGAPRYLGDDGVITSIDGTALPV
jgi:hypothetical protein